MTASQIQDISQAKQTLEQLRAANLQRIEDMCSADGRVLDLAAPIPQSGQSLTYVNTRMLALIGLLERLDTVDDTTLLSISHIKALQQQLDQLVKIQESLRDQLNSMQNDGGIGTIDPDSFMAMSKNGGINVDIGKLFSQIGTSIDETISRYYIASIPFTGEPDFATSFAEFSRQMRAVSAQKFSKRTRKF